MRATPGAITFALLVVLLAVGVALLRWLLGGFTSRFSLAEERHAGPTDPKRIIVPLLDSSTCPDVVEVACRLASEHKAEILLVHVLEIPLTLGLDVPLPDAEEKARHRLQAAGSIVMQHDLKVETRVLRQRTATEAILGLARETGAEAIVTANGNPPWWSSAPLERTVSGLLRRASCPVIVVKTPLG